MLWIPGAKGLLGSAVFVKCKAALHSGHEVDIADLSQVRQYAKTHPGITHIVNCAAFSLVDAAEDHREEAHRANAIGPENLARVAQEINAKLIHISTDYVFPGDLRRPLTETDPVAPCNYYGRSKLEGEQRALALSACVIRISGLFGQGGKNFVSKLLQMLMVKREIQLVDDQWNRFTYAPDLADAILQMLDYTESDSRIGNCQGGARNLGQAQPASKQINLKGLSMQTGHKFRGCPTTAEPILESRAVYKGLYHYANRGVVTKYEFGLAMREMALELGYPVTASIVPVPSSTFPSPCKRPVYSVFDTAKIEQSIPIRPWQEALREFLCAQMPVYS